MPTCDYCGETFSGEEAYLDHLAATHEGELGRIDSRRIEQHRDTGDGGVPRTATAVGVVVALALVAGGGYALAGGNPIWESGDGTSGGAGSTTAAAPTPHDLGAVHYHGPIAMVVDGQRVDFSKTEYQRQAKFFHFEGGDGRRWHGHARDITLERAMATLDIRVTEDSVTFAGTAYTDGENARVSVTVNGEPVTPRTYLLEEGDAIEIVVESE